MEYRFKKNTSIDWAYDDSVSVIHFKFGEAQKHYNFTPEFAKEYPQFVHEYQHYYSGEPSKFRHVLDLVNYIEVHNLPVRLYANMYDEEFEDIEACKEWICHESLPWELRKGLDAEHQAELDNKEGDE